MNIKAEKSETRRGGNKEEWAGVLESTAEVIMRNKNYIKTLFFLQFFSP